MQEAVSNIETAFFAENCHFKADWKFFPLLIKIGIAAAVLPVPAAL